MMTEVASEEETREKGEGKREMRKDVASEEETR